MGHMIGTPVVQGCGRRRLGKAVAIVDGVRCERDTAQIVRTYLARSAADDQ